ncbi:hypothetical protein [Pontixanthobacter sp.]|uniref:hypothetical protein n=1 Tax=Pontixanthobacter sp. TaxID=2792078 RepID=UPI003C7CDBD6
MTPAPSLRIVAAAGSLAVLAIASPSIAQDRDEFVPKGGAYVAILAGVTSPTDGDFSGIQDPQGNAPGAAGAAANVRAEYDDAFQGAVALGYRIPKRVFSLFQPSVELEYSRFSADVSAGSFNGGNQTFAGGADVSVYAVNYQSDIRWSTDQRVIPFLGSGIGVADVGADLAYFPNNGIASAPTFAVRDGDTGLYLQSNAGVTFVINDTADFNTRLRYQRVSGLDLDRRFVAGGADDRNAELEGQFETVSLLAGVRFRF